MSLKYLDSHIKKVRQLGKEIGYTDLREIAVALDTIHLRNQCSDMTLVVISVDLVEEEYREKAASEIESWIQYITDNGLEK